jgi:hypothetical protein
MITLDSEFVMAMLLAGAVCYHLGYRGGIREQLSDEVEEEEDDCEDEDEDDEPATKDCQCSYCQDVRNVIDRDPMEPSHPTTQLPVLLDSYRKPGTTGQQ